MDKLSLLGPIVRLQIQKAPLVVGVRPERVYRTGPLLARDSLAITPDGALAKVDDAWVVDVHHTAHPANSRPNLDRLLSIGFTSHYAAMADHFGSAEVGDAGENIVIKTDRMVTAEDLEGGIIIRRPGGDLELKGAAVAAPCVPFTRYRLGDQSATLDTVKAHRVFRHIFILGFVMGLGNLTEAFEIALGDEVYLRR